MMCQLSKKKIQINFMLIKAKYITETEMIKTTYISDKNINHCYN